MFSKLAYSQKVLRALAQEKKAGVMLPIAAGAAAIGTAHAVKKSLHKGREYKAGFTPGIAESRI